MPIQTSLTFIHRCPSESRYLDEVWHPVYNVDQDDLKKGFWSLGVNDSGLEHLVRWVRHCPWCGERLPRAEDVEWSIPHPEAVEKAPRGLEDRIAALEKIITPGA